MINNWDELVKRERELAGMDEDEYDDEQEEIEFLFSKWYHELEDLEPLERE